MTHVPKKSKFSSLGYFFLEKSYWAIESGFLMKKKSRMYENVSREEMCKLPRDRLLTNIFIVCTEMGCYHRVVALFFDKNNLIFFCRYVPSYAF